MKSKNLPLGIMLLSIGVIALLRTLDIITINWSIVWSLWPILLIVLGVELLPIRSYVKIVLIGLCLAGGFFHYQNRNGEDVTVQWYSEPFDTYENACLNINFGRGELDLGAVCAELLTIQNESENDECTYRSEKFDNDIHIFVNEKKNANARNLTNELKVALNDRQVWDLVVKTGASECNLNLSNYLVKSLDIDGGACDMDVVLGHYDDTTDVSIDSGVSDIDIKVPGDRACKVIVNAGLSSKELTGFEMIKKGVYQTSNFDGAKNPIIIHLNCGVSDISVERI